MVIAVSAAKVTVRKTNGQIHFYLRCSRGTAYLFSQKYTKGVYEYFRRGRSDGELYRYHRWGENPRLDHTIEKCVNPSYRRYAMEELAA